MIFNREINQTRLKSKMARLVAKRRLLLTRHSDRNDPTLKIRLLNIEKEARRLRTIVLRLKRLRSSAHHSGNLLTSTQ